MNVFLYKPRQLGHLIVENGFNAERHHLTNDILIILNRFDGNRGCENT